jgi:AcrR family transcriptional regulator
MDEVQQGTPVTAAARGRGRPRKTGAGDDTRALIVAAAAREFARDGYDSTSMRGVARAAGVDPALVRHYFADKADLFAEAVAAPMRPDRIVARALAGPREHIGENLVRFIVTTLDEPGASDRVLRMLHTALGQEFAARMLRQFIMREVLRRVAKEIHEDDADLRASFAASQVVGLLVARYGLRIEPLASASVDEVVRRIGPVVQWHLTGAPLDRQPSPLS